MRQFFNLCRGWWQLCPAALLIEGLGAWAALWWALQIAQPGDLFATNAAFAGLAARAPENQWGIFFAVGAGLQLAALMVSPPCIRFLALAAGAAVWSGVAAAMSTSAPHGVWGIPQSTGIGMYGGLSGAQIIAMLLLSPHVLRDIRAAFHRWQRSRDA